MTAILPAEGATRTRNQEWVLVLTAPLAAPQTSGNEGGFTDLGALDALAARPLLGLSPPQRLALSAQGAGARAVVVEDTGGHRTAADGAVDWHRLADTRLKLSVYDDRASLPPELATLPTVRVPANAVVHRGLFAALRACGWDGACSLFDTPIDFAPPFGFSPMLVVDAASRRRAEKALLRALRKPQDGWTSTYLNRHVSLALTRWLVRTPLKPNQVSVGILAVGLLGAYLASRGTYGSLVLGAFLFQAQSVLDGCDGEMSRITFRGSHLGEWLDTVGDDLTNYGFFAGAAWGLYTTTGLWPYLAFGAVTVACGLLGSGLEYRYLIRIGSGDLLRYPIGIGKAPKAAATPGEHVPPVKSAPPWTSRVADGIAPLFKRDTFVLLTFVGALLGLLGPFLAVFAVGAVGVLIAVLRAELVMAQAARTARKARVDKEASSDATRAAAGGG